MAEPEPASPCCVLSCTNDTADGAAVVNGQVNGVQVRLFIRPGDQRRLCAAHVAANLDLGQVRDPTSAVLSVALIAPSSAGCRDADVAFVIPGEQARGEDAAADACACGRRTAAAGLSGPPAEGHGLGNGRCAALWIIA